MQPASPIDISLARGTAREVCAQAYRRWGHDGVVASDDELLRAHRDGDLIGLVRLAPEHGVLVLRGMHVAPHARRAGVGHALLEAAVRVIGDRACFCMPYTHLARFYAGAGFQALASDGAPDFLRKRLQQSLAQGLDVCVMLRPASAHARLRVEPAALQRLVPASRAFGFDRGGPVDRHYIERFLAAHAQDIRGAVVEIGDDHYTRRFGGNRVGSSAVLDHGAANPRATIVADLADAPHVPDASFDCAICTQTLMFLFPVDAAVATLHRILRPGGVALVTLAGISQIVRHDMDHGGDWWRFTTASAQRLFEDAFAGGEVEVGSHGNTLAATAFLLGLGMQEVSAQDLDIHDPDYQLIVTVRARKAR
jgi:GNAT superfamily N-acetyltransferase/SAM-dependent methyltransferase